MTFIIFGSKAAEPEQSIKWTGISPEAIRLSAPQPSNPLTCCDILST